MTCDAWIEGVGLLGPGFNSWPQAANVLRGSLKLYPSSAHAIAARGVVAGG